MWHVIEIVAGTLVVLALLGRLLDPSERVLFGIFNMLGGPLAAVHSALERFEDVAKCLSRRLRGNLAYRLPQESEGDFEPNRPPTAFDVIAPVIWAVLFVIVGGGDFVLSTLRFAALLGLNTGPVVNGKVLDLLTGFLYVATTVTYSGVFIEISRGVPTHRPFGLWRDGTRAVGRWIAGIGTSLSLAAAAVLFLWGNGAVAGHPSEFLSGLFIVLFGLIVLGAGAFAFAGAIPFPIVVALAVVVFMRLWVWGVKTAVRLAFEVVDKTYGFLDALLRLPASLGRVLWNWGAGYQIARKYLHVTPIPEPGLRPALGGRWGNPAPGARAFLDDTGVELQASISSATGLGVAGSGPFEAVVPPEGDPVLRERSGNGLVQNPV
jgi:hypothetical protein